MIFYNNIFRTNLLFNKVYYFEDKSWYFIGYFVFIHLQRGNQKNYLNFREKYFFKKAKANTMQKKFFFLNNEILLSKNSRWDKMLIGLRLKGVDLKNWRFEKGRI